VYLPPAAEASPPLPKALTRDAAEQLLHRVRNLPWRTAFERHRNLAIIGLMLLAGLRKGEVRRLTVSDVDLDAGTIRAERGKGKNGGKDKLYFAGEEFSRKELLEAEAVRIQADKVSFHGTWKKVPKEGGQTLSDILIADLRDNASFDVSEKTPFYNAEFRNIKYDSGVIGGIYYFEVDNEHSLPFEMRKVDQIRWSTKTNGVVSLSRDLSGRMILSGDGKDTI